MAMGTDGGYFIQRVTVNAANDGDNTVIAAPGPGKALLVIGYALRSVGAGISIVKSGAAGSQHDSVTGVAAPGTRFGDDAHPDVGIFMTDVNQPLVINNAAGVDTFGFIAYRIITV